MFTNDFYLIYLFLIYLRARICIYITFFLLVLEKLTYDHFVVITKISIITT